MNNANGYRIAGRVASRLFDMMLHGWLLIVLVATLYPFLHVAAVSVSEAGAVMEKRVTFFPVGFDWTAYDVVRFASPPRSDVPQRWQ